MKIILAGYGRVGHSLLQQLVKRGYEVTVIDRKASVFEEFPFEKVRTVQGNVIDEEVLMEGGIQQADVFFAVTGDENANLMAVMIAKHFFHVPRTYALVFDPHRVGKFEEYCDRIFCSTLLTTQEMLDQLDSQEIRVEEPLLPGNLEKVERSSNFVLIVGGGTAGFYLAQELLNLGYEVVVVEKDYFRFEELRGMLDCGVVYGDGSCSLVLHRAGAERASIVAAVTREDQTNLIACVTAKKYFHVPKTIARVTNPKNEHILKSLKVDFTVSATGVLVHNIERGIPVLNVVHLMDLEEGLEMRMYRIANDSPSVGKSIRMLNLPKDCNILFLRRGKSYEIARGETVIAPGDEVVALFHHDKEPLLRTTLLGGNKK
ncbi:MAG: NAD-binding protein [bacterium]